MGNSVFKNDIWQLPFLPPQCKNINGIENIDYCITNRVIGEWEFLPEPIREIPSPYCQNQNFDFSNVKKEWVDVLVPSSLTMQGFDIKNNTEYYYRKNINVSKDFDKCSMRAFIRFEGVYSNSRIWVNGNYKSTHIGGFTPFVVEITDDINQNMILELVVGVSDIEGNSLGTWNEKQNKISDCAWASFYAHFNVGGILRNVTIFYLPKSCFLLSNKVKGDFSPNINKGTLDINALIVASGEVSAKVCLVDTNGKEIFAKNSKLSKDDKLESEVYSKQFALDFDNFKYVAPSAKLSDKKYSDLYVPFKRCELKGSLYNLNLNECVGEVIGWTAEKPYLYTLKIELVINGNTVKYEQNIGFRRIDFAGSNGTDKNKIYINGKEIKLRGVCRHDVSHKFGRSVSKEEELQEILAFKRNNINHIRTSHYPVSENYLQLCDKYGIYVELENGVCFKGGNGYDMYCAAEELVQNMSEMVELGYSHPSVLIWSIGNESGFEKSSGFRYSYDYLREKDKSRPVVFSYPFNVHSKPLPYDIYSKHYNNVSKFLGKKDMPKIHDEFAHVACYNLADLSVDNNYRLAWGDSIKLGWENMLKDDGALGSAIWGGIDDVFFVPENISVIHSKHSSAKALGYGEWGAVLDAFKREKPEAFLTKKAFSPIRISNIEVEKNNIRFNVKNWFDHTNLREVKCVISNEKNIALFEDYLPCDVAPKACSIVKLDVNLQDSEQVYIAMYFDGIEIEKELYTIKKPFKNRYEFVKSYILPIKNNTDLLIKTDQSEFALGPYMYVQGRRVKAKSRKVKMQNISGRSQFVITENFGLFKNAKYLLKEKNDGSFRVEVLNSAALAMTLGNNFGVAFEFCQNPISVAWEKECLYSCYPSEHLDGTKGVAFKDFDTNNKYGEKPNNDWKYDTYDYFLNDEAEEDKLYVTQDFKTTRTDIIYYSANFDKSSFVVGKNDCKINCLTKYSKVIDYVDIKSKRVIIKGSWKIIHKNDEKCCIVSRKKDSSISIDFDGRGVKIFGTRSKEQGEISLYIDGKLIRTISTRSDICDTLDFMVLDTITGLENSKHNLTIKLCDNNGVRISGFEAINSTEKKSKSELYVSRGKYYPSLLWGNYYGKKLQFNEKRAIMFDFGVAKKQE